MNESIESMHRDGMSASKIYKLLKKHVSRSGVFKAVKRFRQTGTYMPRIGKTPKKPVRTKRLIKKTREKLSRNPARSVTKLAAEAHISPFTLQKLLKKDLKVKAYKITKRQLWPPSSPDLNPINFGVWSTSEQKACTASCSSVVALKKNLTKI